MSVRVADLFAGAGGFSEGARQAGCQVVWAGNHWQDAVNAHQENHPEAVHACEDLHRVDWTQVPRMDVLLAAPCCQGHSNARGKDRPHHDTQRSTAWAVVDALECHRPPAGLVENVPEFLKWELYPAWKSALEALGYAVSPHLANATDHGLAQDRERMIIVLTRSTAAIQLNIPKRPAASADQVIDFDEGSWSLVDHPKRAPATLRRVASGRARFGHRFVMPYYKSGSGLTGRCLTRPLGTVTTKDRWAVVDGDRMRMVSRREYVDFMGFPRHYWLPRSKAKALHMLGNAVCPPMAKDYIEALCAQG